MKKGDLKVIGGTVGLLACLCFVTKPAYAIFGFGDIVFDPTSLSELGKIWTEDISMGAKLAAEVNQLTKIYSTGMQLYNTTKFMTSRFSSGGRAQWMTTAQQYGNLYTQNRYGETVMWPAMINGRSSLASPAWTSATVAIEPSAMPGVNAETAPVAGQSKDIAMLAFVEQTDGASVQCLQTISQYNQNAQLNQRPIGFFKLSATDDSDSTGSMVEQMILHNFGLIQQGNEQRAQGSIQSCLAQQQVLANKLTRDEIASTLNTNQQIHQDLSSFAWDGDSELGTAVIP